MSNIFSCFFGMSILLNFVFLLGFLSLGGEINKLRKELEDAQHQLEARRTHAMRAFVDPDRWT